MTNHIKICSYLKCQKSFVVTSKSKNQKCCSKECSRLFRSKHNQQVIRSCLKCETMFTFVPKDGYYKLYCSRKCSNFRCHSIETKKKMSDYAKANPRGAILLNHSLSAKPKIKGKRSINIIKITCPCGVEFEKKPNNPKKYHNRECAHKHNYHPNSTRKKRSFYKGFQMDSGTELAFAQLLDKHNICWTKNTTICFPFVDSCGKHRKYYPDFYLEDYDYWVEIKGKYYIRPDDDLRLKSVPRIERIMSDNIRLPSFISL